MAALRCGDGSRKMDSAYDILASNNTVLRGSFSKKRRHLGNQDLSSGTAPLHGALARRLDDKNPRPHRRRRTTNCLKLTEGQAHDGRSAVDMFDTVQVGNILLADRAYDSDALRETLRKRGAWGNIRLMPNRENRPAFSAWLYRQRNVVERFFNKIKQFRAVATRYDKRDDNFLASIKLASLRIWLRSYESVP